MSKSSTREHIHSAVIVSLREQREKIGMSMNMLASKSGLSLAMISFVERDLRKPTLDTLLRMAEALGVRLGPFIVRAEKVVQAANKK